MAALGRSLPVVTTACAGQIESNRLVSANAIDWSVAIQMGDKLRCNYAAARQRALLDISM